MVGTTALKFLTPDHPVALAKGHCLRYRYAPSDCRVCVERCPHDALTATPRGLELNQGKCNSCLLCLSSCPTSALDQSHFNLIQKLQQLARHPQPVLGCTHCSTAAHERIPCLGLLASAETLLAVASVMPNPLQLNMTACEQCPNSEIVPALKAALEYLEQLTDYPFKGRLNLISAAADLQYRDAGLSRREFFTLFRHKSSSTAVRMVDRLARGQERTSYQNKRISRPRSLLLKALPGIPENFKPQVEAAFYPNLRINDSCRRCTGCVGICPSGAIKPSSSQKQPPEVHAELCNACGACVKFCRQKAIDLSYRRVLPAEALQDTL